MELTVQSDLRVPLVRLVLLVRTERMAPSALKVRQVLSDQPAQLARQERMAPTAR